LESTRRIGYESDYGNVRGRLQGIGEALKYCEDESFNEIAGFILRSFNSTYNATKAFFDSFSFALRNELKDTGVTVTCLMHGAIETEFFERADMLDTKIGQTKKDDPADVAKQGYEAMLSAEGDIVTSL
jgi:short-subunit dehydrogenase